MKATALIAEDEPLLAAHLRQELLRLWPQAEVCAVADRFGEHRAHPNAPSTTHSVAPSIAA